jgi:hypothetical protein
MTGPPAPEIPKPAKPRLTPEQVLERMRAVQREFEVEKAFRREPHDPWRRLVWVLGIGVAFTSIALLTLRMALTQASPGTQHNWIVPPAGVSLFLVPSGGAKMPLRSGASLMIAAPDEPLRLQAEGIAEDREALLVAEDDFGRLTTVWPRGGTLRSGGCPRGDCTQLEVLLAPRTLPPGSPRLALWIGPGPIDASGLLGLGRGEPPALSGARASAWLKLER